MIAKVREAWPACSRLGAQLLLEAIQRAVAWEVCADEQGRGVALRHKDDITRSVRREDRPWHDDEQRRSPERGGHAQAISRRTRLPEGDEKSAGRHEHEAGSRQHGTAEQSPGERVQRHAGPAPCGDESEYAGSHQQAAERLAKQFAGSPHERRIQSDESSGYHTWDGSREHAAEAVDDHDQRGAGHGQEPVRGRDVARPAVPSRREPIPEREHGRRSRSREVRLSEAANRTAVVVVHDQTTGQQPIEPLVDRLIGHAWRRGLAHPQRRSHHDHSEQRDQRQRARPTRRHSA